MALKGIPRFGGYGIDLSSRMGADSLLTFGEPREYKEDNVLAYAMRTIAGAPGGLVFDQGKALGKFVEGDILGGAQLLPMLKFISDTMKAANDAYFDKTSGTTGKVTQGATGIGLTSGVNALGFRTAGQAERREKQSAQYRETAALREESTEGSKLRNRYAQAKNEGERVKVLADLKRYNAKVAPAQQITPAKLKQFAREYQRDEKKGETVGPFRLRNKAEAERVRNAGSYYNAE